MSTCHTSYVRLAELHLSLRKSKSRIHLHIYIDITVISLSVMVFVYHAWIEVHAEHKVRTMYLPMLE